MQTAGLRKVCPSCGSADVVLDWKKIGGTCNGCKRKIDVFLDMKFSEIKPFKQELARNANKLRFSITRCEEIHAFWFIVVAVVVLLAFIILSTMPRPLP